MCDEQELLTNKTNKVWAFLNGRVVFNNIQTRHRSNDEHNLEIISEYCSAAGGKADLIKVLLRFLKHILIFQNVNVYKCLRLFILR